MSKTIAVLMGSVLITCIVSVAVLIAFDKPVDSLIQFLATILIPSAVSFYAAHKADKAAVAAEKTVHQTNGRMTELIEWGREQGKEVPDGFEDIDPGPSVTEKKSPKVDRGVRYHVD